VFLLGKHYKSQECQECENCPKPPGIAPGSALFSSLIPVIPADSSLSGLLFPSRTSTQGALTDLKVAKTVNNERKRSRKRAESEESSIMSKLSKLSETAQKQGINPPQEAPLLKTNSETGVRQ